MHRAERTHSLRRADEHGAEDYIAAEWREHRHDCVFTSDASRVDIWSEADGIGNATVRLVRRRVRTGIWPSEGL